ncbi:MBL fold metallo-hydrolase [Reichenbachiella sp.]|uniref:MBL fold metallo-hydrolase n=1 Tax=Reichenbachiella sp. TaxID=2184521 RepID=UPI003296F729
MNSLIRTFLIISGVFTVSCANGQNSGTISADDPRTSQAYAEAFLQANARGLAILNEASQAHGDIADSSLVVALTIEVKEGIHRGQSLVVDPPYERYHLENKFFIDRKNNIEVGHFMNRFAGFDFVNIIITDDEASRDYNVLTKKYTDATSSGFDNFRYFPHPYIKAAMARPKHVCYEGSVDYKGKTVNRIFVGGGSSARRLYFDAEKGYLLRVEYLRNNEPYGDGVSFKDFSNFEKFGPLTLPQVIASGGNYSARGEVVNRFELRAIDPVVNRPTHEQMIDFTPADYSQVVKNQLTELGNNIYMIENITESMEGDDYNVMFAVFEKFILVGEAPVNAATSEKVLRHIRSVSDKPIKYLVQSHHHNDHWGGIRTYIAKGTTIITTKGNAAILKRIASAPSVLNPDRQWEDPKPLSMDLVTERLQINDSGNAALIYDVGPTNHANEMLIVYFPEQGLLWQADLISYGEWDLNDPRSDHLLSKIKSLNLKVKKIAGVHGHVFEGVELQKWLNK